MKVTLKIFGPLRQNLFSSSLLKSAETVIFEGETLDQFLSRYSLSPFGENIVLVNGRHEGPSYVLGDGDLISILPEIAGG